MIGEMLEVLKKLNDYLNSDEVKKVKYEKVRQFIVD